MVRPRDEVIAKHVRLQGGNKAAAARAMGLSRAAVWRAMKRVNASGGPKRAPLLADPPTDRVRQLEVQLRTAKNVAKFERDKWMQTEVDLETANNRIQLLEETASVKPRSVRPVKPGQNGGSATAIICATDWHAEGRISAASTGVHNEFNLRVAEARIERLWQKSVYLIEFARNISNINEVVLWLGGDLINGAIHEELEETNFLGPGEAIIWAQDRVASGIDYLLDNAGVDLVWVVTNHGNHGRTTKRKRIATSYRHSWEWVAYKNLERFYRKDSRVRFSVGQGYHNICGIQGHTVRFHHGDAIRYHGGVGGITIPIRKKIAQWNKHNQAKLDILGHFHTFVDMWDLVCCGALCGFNEYALEIAADYQPPTQTFVVIDEACGKVMAVPIFVASTKELELCR